MVEENQERGRATILDELKRRNVLRVATFYIVFSWLTLQVTDIVIPALGIPSWGVTLVLVLLVLGFPIALFIAWVFELTPEGFRRETEVDRTRSITLVTGRRIDFLIIGVLCAAVVLLLVDRFVLSHRPGDAPLPEKTVAVLPFQNLGGDAQSGAFSDGLAETLLHTLAQVGGLHVAARTSSFQFREQGGDIAEIARQLRVRNILEGSVRQAGGTIRVTAQLIDAEYGFHLWSGSYDRELHNIFAIQDDIAARVAQALELTLLGRTAALPNDGATSSIEAYTQYLLGRREQVEFSYQSLPRAEARYLDALRIDQDYALALIALAENYFDMRDTGLIETDTAIARIAPVLSRARDLVGDNAGLLTLEGQLGVLRHDERAAQAAFESALRADPDNASTLTYYADFLGERQGGTAQALQYAQRALQFDPLGERLLTIYGKILHRLGRTDDALEQFAKVRSVSPLRPAGYYLPGILHMESGNYVEATRWFLEALRVDPDDHEIPMQIARLMLDMRDPDAARHWLEKSRAVKDGTAAFRAGQMDLHAYLGEREAGLTLARTVLESGAPERYGARWVALWWLLGEALRSGDDREFLTWMQRLYPALFQAPAGLNTANHGYASLLVRAWLQGGEPAAGKRLAEQLLQHIDVRTREDPREYLQDRVVLLAVLGRIPEALDVLAEAQHMHVWEALWALEIEPDLGPLQTEDRFRQALDAVSAELARQRLLIRERFGL